MAVDLMSEIEALRSQIDALSKQMPKPAEPQSAAKDALDVDHWGALGIDSETVDKIKEQFDGFVELIEKHLHEVPAGTAIAIFALGVLLGRLLPR
jgi:hypothetical protein